MVEVPVYNRAGLVPGTHLAGPLIVEQQDTTLVVGPQHLAVDDLGSTMIGLGR